MLYYVAFYVSVEDNARRQNIAGVEKANYIIKTFNDLGNTVTILSNAKSAKNRGIGIERIRLSDKGIYLLTFASLRKGKRIWDVLNAVYGLIQLFLYLLLFVHKDDTVCVYHSMGYRGLFTFIRRIKKFKYILEVEELYQYFDANKSNYKKKENEVLSEPDAFIFSNFLMENEVNKGQKPSVFVNGVYRNKKCLLHVNRNENKENKIVRLVYAGGLEQQKGIGKILDVINFLDDCYEVRIIGFGSEEDTQKVKKRVRELNKRGKKVIFDGIKVGEDYNFYLQQCDIGLCIQDNGDVFNQFEFPSKVISYMANGLTVITNNLIQIRTSELADYINIIESNDSHKIASYINSRRYQIINTKDILDKLDKDFHDKVRNMLKNLK